VGVGGSSLPAVRVELNHRRCSSTGRAGGRPGRAGGRERHSPKGAIENATLHWQIYDNDQSARPRTTTTSSSRTANGSPVRLTTSPRSANPFEDIRNLGLSKGEPAVLVIISRQPQQHHRHGRPSARSCPGFGPTSRRRRSWRSPRTGARSSGPRFAPWSSRSRSRSSSWFSWCTSSCATVGRCWSRGRVPVSLIGTFAAMYVLGYSLDNLSLMALTIATGFVVDDAIVRHGEHRPQHGERRPRFQAALIGVRQVGFTVLSMSLSLIAVFIRPPYGRRRGASISASSR